MVYIRHERALLRMLSCLEAWGHGRILLRPEGMCAVKAGQLTRLPPTQRSHTSRSLASLKRASTAMIAAFTKRFGSGEEVD